MTKGIHFTMTLTEAIAILGPVDSDGGTITQHDIRDWEGRTTRMDWEAFASQRCMVDVPQLKDNEREMWSWSIVDTALRTLQVESF